MQLKNDHELRTRDQRDPLDQGALDASGRKITGGQRTIPGQDDHLSGQTFGLPVVSPGRVKKSEKQRV